MLNMSFRCHLVCTRMPWPQSKSGEDSQRTPERGEEQRAEARGISSTGRRKSDCGHEGSWAHMGSQVKPVKGIRTPG